MNTKQPDLITVQELAGHLKIPVATIYGWRSRGEGPPSLKIGRHVRFRIRDVQAWIESKGNDSGTLSKDAAAVHNPSVDQIARKDSTNDTT